MLIDGKAVGPDSNPIIVFFIFNIILFFSEKNNNECNEFFNKNLYY